MRVLIAGLLGSLALAAGASAATLEVENHNETGPGSLGYTILEAAPGDTIVLGPGEYPLTEGETLLAQGNTIRGAGEGVTTVVPTGGGDAAIEGTNIVNATVAEPLNPKGGEDGDAQIETKAQILALVVTLAIFALILELVRRRRLVERYALLWMTAAIVLLILSIWTDGLDVLADAMGIEEPANAIFILAFGVIFLLLLNFSVATSRLSEETKILAQETARLEQELRATRGELPNANGEGPSAAGAEETPRKRPVRAKKKS
ncbi:MAG TPA: DUF2304 family protein [Solirubrobacterales bacterium]|nr:DUF2304 family protein [Solirubrobacterales bacterium]